MQRRIRFSTFGSIDLESPDGTVLRSVLAQPRRTAILAYLALARPRGFHRRDTLVAMFWPESAQRPARDLLNTNISRLRAALGAGALLSRGTEEIGIDDTVVWTDVREFEDALADGRTQHALELYRGDLVAGFHITDAPDFERWLEAERVRFRDMAANAAFALADYRRRAGDLASARALIDRAAALSQGDDAATCRTITLLDSVGDRAAALGFYDAFCVRLREDYDTEPSPETRQLIDRVRARRHSPSTAAPAVVATAPQRRSSTAQPPSSAISDRSPIPRVWAEKVLHRASASRRRHFVALAAALLGVAAFRGRPRPAPASATGTDQVAVFPFISHGDDADDLRDGMMDLLTAKLDGVARFRGVNPRAVLQRSRRTPRAAASSDAAAGVARDLGASYFILGTSTRVGGRLRLHAALYTTASADQFTSVADAEGSASAPFDVVDRLARGLLAGRIEEATGHLARVGAETAHSMEALRAYLAGEQLYRRSQYAAASDAFQRAVALDSTFALAYYRLSNAAAWLGRDSISLSASDRSAALAWTVPMSEAHLFHAWNAYVYGQGDRAEQIYRTVVTERPNDGEAWYRLGEVLFHYGPTYGRTLVEARQAFERLHQLEPGNLEALVHLARIAAHDRAFAHLDALIAEVRSLGAPRSDVLELTELRAAVHRDYRGEAAVRDSLVLADDHLTESISRAAIAFAEDPGAAARLGLARHADGAAPQSVLSRILLAHAELAQGHWRASNAELDRLAQVAPALAREQRAVLGTLPFLELPPSELRDMLSNAATRLPQSAGYAEPGQLSLQPPWTGRYSQALLHVALAEGDAALDIARELEASPAARLRTRDDTVANALHRQLARVIRVRVQEQAGDVRGALHTLGAPALPSLRVLPGIMQQPTAAERFLRARLLQKLGHPDEALRWLASMPDPSGYDAVYLAPSHFLRATIYLARADTAAATAHYRRVLELWGDADPELQPMVRAARSRLQRLAR